MASRCHVPSTVICPKPVDVSKDIEISVRVEGDDPAGGIHHGPIDGVRRFRCSRLLQRQQVGS